MASLYARAEADGSRLPVMVLMILYEALDCIAADDLVQVTPQNLWMRKKELPTASRSRHRAAAAR